MNRIHTLFKNRKKNILSIYFTAGHPTVESIVPIINELENQGVDMVEVGFPFSDPLADGPVIQKSSLKALDNGTTLKKIIAKLKDIRKSCSIPLLLMGYLNTVLQYGMENFLKDISAIGIDGVILPDMPMEVFEDEYKTLFAKHKISPVFLISPNTTDSRIKKAESLSEGFIYAVSSASTTGSKSGFADENEAYFKRLSSMGLSLPVIVGFGISNNKTFNQVCKYLPGGIIGSAFVNAINNNEHPEKVIGSFIKMIKEG